MNLLIFFENASSFLLTPLLHHLRSHIRPLFYQLLRSLNISCLELRIYSWPLIFWTLIHWNFIIRNSYPLARGWSFLPIYFSGLNIYTPRLLFFLLYHCVSSFDLFLLLRHDFLDIYRLLFFNLLFFVNSTGVGLGGVHKMLNSISFIMIRL